MRKHTKAEDGHLTEAVWTTIAALQDAYGQALDELDPAKVIHVAHRVERLQASLLRGYEDRALGPVFLVISYVLAELLEWRPLALVKGSAFWRCSAERGAGNQRAHLCLTGVTSSHLPLGGASVGGTGAPRVEAAGSMLGWCGGRG